MRPGRTAREERQKRAQDRLKDRLVQDQTPEQRLKTLDNMFGDNEGAKNERARAKAKIEAQRKKTPGVKTT